MGLSSDQSTKKPYVPIMLCQSIVMFVESKNSTQRRKNATETIKTNRLYKSDRKMCN